MKVTENEKAEVEFFLENRETERVSEEMYENIVCVLRDDCTDDKHEAYDFMKEAFEDTHDERLLEIAKDPKLMKEVIMRIAFHAIEYSIYPFVAPKH